MRNYTSVYITMADRLGYGLLRLLLALEETVGRAARQAVVAVGQAAGRPMMAGKSDPKFTLVEGAGALPKENSGKVSPTLVGGNKENDTSKTPEEKRPGAEELLAGLIDRHGNAILRLSYSYLHNMEDAEDILQDTLIKYLEKRPEFFSEAHEKAWLLKVSANLSKNRIQYNKLREADELDENLTAEKREDLSFVWEAVKKLPVNNAEAIHLFYQEGYSTKEIAEILGRKESTIRSDLKRGRERLKLILKEAYDFE